MSPTDRQYTNRRVSVLLGSLILLLTLNTPLFADKSAYRQIQSQKLPEIGKFVNIISAQNKYGGYDIFVGNVPKDGGFLIHHYTLDKNNILKYQRGFGKNGQGPGEFVPSRPLEKFPMNNVVSPQGDNGVFVSAHPKSIWFYTSGEHKDEKNPNPGRAVYIIPFGKCSAIIYSNKMAGDESILSLKDNKEERVLMRFTMIGGSSNPFLATGRGPDVSGKMTVPFRFFDIEVCGNNAYVVWEDGSTVKLVSIDSKKGNIGSSFKIEGCTAKAVSEDVKNRYAEALKTLYTKVVPNKVVPNEDKLRDILRQRFNISDVFPLFVDMLIFRINEQELFCFSQWKKEGEEVSTCLITDGKNTADITLPLADMEPLSFPHYHSSGNKLFTLEDDGYDWILKVYEIGKPNFNRPSEKYKIKPISNPFAE